MEDGSARRANRCASSAIWKRSAIRRIRRFSVPKRAEGFEIRLGLESKLVHLQDSLAPFYRRLEIRKAKKPSHLLEHLIAVRWIKLSEIRTPYSMLVWSMVLWPNYGDRAQNYRGSS